MRRMAPDPGQRCPRLGRLAFHLRREPLRPWTGVSSQGIQTDFIHVEGKRPVDVRGPVMSDAPVRSRRIGTPRFRKDADARQIPDAIQEAREGLAEVEKRDRGYRRALASSDALAAATAL